MNNAHGIAQDFYDILFCSVNNPVAVVYPTAPVTAEFSFQRIRLTDAGKGISQNIPQELIDTTQSFLVLCLPIQIILPGGFGEQDFIPFP